MWEEGRGGGLKWGSECGERRGGCGGGWEEREGGRGGEEVSEMGGEGGREGGRGEEEGQRNEAVSTTIREYLTKKRGRSGMENSAMGARVLWRW